MRKCRRRACRVPGKGGLGKIDGLRREARENIGVRAECLLSMLGSASQATDDETARAYTGAMFFAEMIHDIRQIKRLLTPAK